MAFLVGRLIRIRPRGLIAVESFPTDRPARHRQDDRTPTMSKLRRRWARFTASQFADDLGLLACLAACAGILVLVDYLANH